jgi:ribosomal protein S16
MLIIRLKKIAFKKNLTYSIVIITPSKSAKSNQFVEKIGYYKPLIDH